MSARKPIRARLTRISLRVEDPARFAADLGAVFGMRFAPDDDASTRLRGPDGYELAAAASPGVPPLHALVFAVDAFAEAVARLERAGATCVADQFVDGCREMTWIGTLLTVPVTIRDSDPASEGAFDG